MREDSEPLYTIGEQVYAYNTITPRTITERVFAPSHMAVILGENPCWYYRLNPCWQDMDWVPEHALSRKFPELSDEE